MRAHAKAAEHGDIEAAVRAAKTQQELFAALAGYKQYFAADAVGGWHDIMLAFAEKKSAPVPFNKETFKNDPLIQKALEIFKGQIVEVRA